MVLEGKYEEIDINGYSDFIDVFCNNGFCKWNRDRRRDCIKALDALFSDQGTLHLALPPLPTLLIGLDGSKKRSEALRSRLRP